MQIIRGSFSYQHAKGLLPTWTASQVVYAFFALKPRMHSRAADSSIRVL